MDERFTLCRVEDDTWVVTHPTGLSNYDFAFAPTFRVSHPARLDGEVTAIARTGAATDYGARYEVLRAQGIRLVHTPETYRRTSLLPVWYPRVEGLTPRSLCFDASLDAEAVGATLGWPVFVKVARQTSRHNKALWWRRRPRSSTPSWGVAGRRHPLVAARRVSRVGPAAARRRAVERPAKTVTLRVVRLGCTHAGPSVYARTGAATPLDDEWYWGLRPSSA